VGGRDQEDMEENIREQNGRNIMRSERENKEVVEAALS
jgi:hypothetical protein